MVTELSFFSHSVRFDTLMTDEEKSIAFARDILSLIDNR